MRFSTFTAFVWLTNLPWFGLAQLTSVYYCELLVEVVKYCIPTASSTSTQAMISEASCLCSSRIGTVPWGPSSFDQVVLDCISQIDAIPSGSIAASGFLSDASLFEGFCTKNLSTFTTASEVTAMTTSSSILSLSASLTSSPTPGAQSISSSSASKTTSPASLGTPTASPNAVNPLKFDNWLAFTASIASVIIAIW